ncbi:MAG: Mn2+/Fe2+ NRAMP family transporter [Litorivivens sp.]
MIAKNLFKTLGPGILFASTAIGVSHLVQSTRAGAEYGFALVGIILLANIMKYPFFEFGSRYANVTGESLIDGYRKMGKWMLAAYIFITLGSMFFVIAAVGIVTAGFLDNLFGIGNLPLVTACLFVASVMILIFGKYGLLDSLIKVVAAVLFISTIAAFFLTLFHGPATTESLIPTMEWDAKDLGFLIALMGWMPTAVDLSVWNSLWTLERIKQTGFKPTLKETLFEFRLGYITSAILSICFVTLGAFLMFGTGEAFPDSSAQFAHHVVSLYTRTMGDWSYFIIGSAAFAIMLGTCIAVFDGYSRALGRCVSLIKPSTNVSEGTANNSVILIFAALGSYAIIHFLLFANANTSGFKMLIDLATTISFLIAPLIAIVNYRLVTSSSFPEADRPGTALKVLSICGILFLSAFSIFFLVC